MNGLIDGRMDGRWMGQLKKRWTDEWKKGQRRGRYRVWVGERNTTFAFCTTILLSPKGRDHVCLFTTVLLHPA